MGTRGTPLLPTLTLLGLLQWVRVDGFAMAVGGGLSVLLINFLFRLGVSGDLEREREEEARRYLDEHGVWPDERSRR